MDIFQLMGDFLHLVGILLLLLKILASKNVLGLSYKTQQIYLVVFLTRYSDMILENHWGSVYFNIMRFIFIGITGATVYYMRFKKPYKHSYDFQADAFPHYYLYLSSFIIGLIWNTQFTLYGIFLSFSWWLQAVAILPQLYMIALYSDVQNITAHIVFFLGLYRFFYILHWMYHWNSIIWATFTAGVLQTVLYADFIYYFIKSNQNQRIIGLPI